METSTGVEAMLYCSQNSPMT